MRERETERREKDEIDGVYLLLQQNPPGVPAMVEVAGDGRMAAG